MPTSASGAPRTSGLTYGDKNSMATPICGPTTEPTSMIVLAVAIIEALRALLEMNEPIHTKATMYDATEMPCAKRPTIRRHTRQYWTVTACGCGGGSPSSSARPSNMASASVPVATTCRIADTMRTSSSPITACRGLIELRAGRPPTPRRRVRQVSAHVAGAGRQAAAAPRAHVWVAACGCAVWVAACRAARAPQWEVALRPHADDGAHHVHADRRAERARLQACGAGRAPRTREPAERSSAGPEGLARASRACSAPIESVIVVARLGRKLVHEMDMANTLAHISANHVHSRSVGSSTIAVGGALRSK